MSVFFFFQADASNDIERMKKDFMRVFDGMMGRQSRGELWRDFVYCSAATIAQNTPAGPRFGEREARYRQTMAKYDGKRRSELVKMFALLCTIIEEGMRRGAYEDYLGDLFMRLELSSAMNGQFFTPFHLCRLMARLEANVLIAQIEKMGWVSVNEPACGAGATLIAVAEAMHQRGIEWQQRMFFTGQDLDETCALMCYIQLSLLGCAGYVHIGNTLAAPVDGPLLRGDMGTDTWYTPAWNTGVWAGRMFWERSRERA